VRIQTKLTAIALLPLVFFVTVTSIDHWSYKVIGDLYPQGALAGEISQTVFRLVGLTYEYEITHGDRAATQWNNQYAMMNQLLDGLPSVYGPSADGSRFAPLRAHVKKIGQMFAEIVSYGAHPERVEDNPLSAVVMTNMVNRLILELQAMIPQTDALHNEVVRSMQQAIKFHLTLTVAISLALALSMLGLAFWLIKGIGFSLRKLQEGVQSVSGGDLGYRLNLASRDELGDFGRGFDAMTAKLAEITVSRQELVNESTALRETQTALTAREAQLTQAQRLAKVGSWELDLTANILVWSDEIYQIFEIDQASFGVSYEAFLAAIHPEDREMVNQAYTNSLATRRPYDVVHRLLMADGRIKFVHERGETHYGDDGTPLRSLGTVQDITDRMRIEEEIRQFNETLEQRVAARTDELLGKAQEVEDGQRALMNIVEDLNQKTIELEAANHKLQDVDRLKSMFIASMSHELRTPLNSIIGFSSIVLEEWLGPLNDEQKDKLAIVLRTGKHLLSLINDLIDISKVEAGKLETMPEEFNLADLVTEVARLSEAEMAAKGITLQVEAAPQVMYTDRRRLYQCLINLVGNAVKFTRTGTITVKAGLAQGSGEMVVISVRDSGIGIHEEDLPKLFTSFLRLQLPDDMQAKGTGLGLYLVRKIASEILDGTVSATSVYGQGSEFTLAIPARLARNGPGA